jgi:hypothetical protein
VDERLQDPGNGLFSRLIGRWRGQGVVTLPSVAPRAYEEEVRFAVRSERSLDYWQRAIDATDGSMLHSETGIWRVAPDGRVEISPCRAPRKCLRGSSRMVGSP